MNEDAVLLERFVHQRSEAAFAELVRRHVDLVYGAAMRRTGGNRQMAEDVAQLVFIALARQASRLERDTVLPAWLHTATRNAALKLMISEDRRRKREARVFSGTVGDAGEATANWDEVKPLLDAAIDSLPTSDRAAVVLRFLERRAFAEIGGALGVSEDAARMRTERALEKLRAILGRQGIRSTAAALAAVVAAQPLVSAPAGFAATLAAHAYAAAGLGGLVGAVVSFMSTKTIAAGAISAVVAFLIGGYVGLGRATTAEVESPPDLRMERTIQALQLDNRRLQDEAAALQAETTTLRGEMTTLKEANAGLVKAAEIQSATQRRSPNIGMVRHELQMAVMSNLRQIAAARDQYRIDRGASAESVHALVGRDRYIRTIRTVGGEDYAELPMHGNGPLTVVTPDGISVTYDPAGVLTTKLELPPEVARVEEMGQRLAPVINKALAAYRAANNNANPPDEKALVSYFATVQEGADFLEFVEAQKAANRR